MIWKRILSAVPIFGFVYGVMWCDARYAIGWGLVGLQLILCTLALREFFRFARTRGWRPLRWFGYLMLPLLFLGQEQWLQETLHGATPLLPAPLDIMTLLVVIAVVGAFTFEIFRKNLGGAMGNIAGNVMGLAYCFYLFSFFGKIRHLGVPSSQYGWSYDGVEFVLLFICIAKASDVGGLLVGSKLGKHKICPQLSPKKSWEGAFGGIFASTALLFAFCLCEPSGTVAGFGWLKILGMGVLLAVTGLIGDLIESALKRDSEVKDAGDCVPGFGGILDMLDSLMISGPCLYYYLIFVCGAVPGA